MLNLIGIERNTLSTINVLRSQKIDQEVNELYNSVHYALWWQRPASALIDGQRYKLPNRAVTEVKPSHVAIQSRSSCRTSPWTEEHKFYKLVTMACVISWKWQGWSFWEAASGDSTSTTAATNLAAERSTPPPRHACLPRGLLALGAARGLPVPSVSLTPLTLQERHSRRLPHPNFHLRDIVICDKHISEIVCARV